MSDTIVALATPTGRSGIGVIRLSGGGSLEILKKLTLDKDFSPQPRAAVLKKLYDPESADVVDETIVTYFQSPQSFTGEDVIEISGHGSPVVLRRIIDLCLKYDARMAEAGEFTLRALANGQIDLSQAEAIRDLIDAQTVASAKLSVRQLGGEISHQLQPIKDSLLEIIVLLESALEFVEDDLPDYQRDNALKSLTAISDDLDKMASTFSAGKLIREGLRIALVGRPNVGKSSLFNALLGHERAIVTEIAGTTRDQIHERFTVDNIPISLIDTAGLRETSDTVEKIGVERSRRTIADADLVVVMLDGSTALDNEDLVILREVSAFPHLIAVNKIDLVSQIDLAQVTSEFPGSKIVRFSAKTEENISTLTHALIEPFNLAEVNNAGFIVSDARHHDLIVRSGTEIDRSYHLLAEGASEEIVLIGLHNAIRFLGQITGETTTEDMLTQIFATFCIGK